MRRKVIRPYLQSTRRPSSTTVEATSIMSGVAGHLSPRDHYSTVRDVPLLAACAPGVSCWPCVGHGSPGG